MAGPWCRNRPNRDLITVVRLGLRIHDGKRAGYTIPANSSATTAFIGRLAFELVINGAPTLGTVLVCDDEEINRALLERLLKKFGYEVVPVSSGDEAVSMLRHRHVDLVLLDVQMPGINGFEVCAYLKHAPETRLIPIALVTGLDAREHKSVASRPAPTTSSESRSIPRSCKPGSRRSFDSSGTRMTWIRRGMLRSLALMVEARDPYTDGHCERLARYAIALARSSANLPKTSPPSVAAATSTTSARSACPIRCCSSRQSPSEFDRIKQHPIIGDRLCGELRSLRQVRASFASITSASMAAATRTP